MSPELDPRVERTRRAVLAAAIDVLIECGFEALTIDSVAERSGVARSTVYRNWCDRPTLLIEAFDRLCEGDSGVIPDTGSLAGDLELLADRLLGKLQDERWRRTVPSLIGAAAIDDSLRDLMASFGAERRDEARQVLLRAVARGEIEDRGQLDGALERFVAPFFMRVLMWQLPLDAGFVRSQVEATLTDLQPWPATPITCVERWPSHRSSP